MTKFYELDKFYYNENGNYVYDKSTAPFDGKPYLVRTNTGIVEAWWDEGGWSDENVLHPREYEGWQWVCYDDAFQLEFDDVKSFAFIDDEPEWFQDYMKTIRYDQDTLTSIVKIRGPEDFYGDVDFTAKLNISNSLKLQANTCS